MKKNTFAKTPPMGWNSYDYYDTTVNEEQIRANADFMAKHMKDAGWEYIVVDIEWYAKNPGSQRDIHQYIPFAPVEMDAYSRLLPDTDRFPSAKDGQGFKPLADYVHSLGLKFGIHIMRGIPRGAAHDHTPILGTDITANEAADPSNICFWNPDMYGLRGDNPGSVAYYDSIIDLYAQWGVDFIKVDDICRMDMPTAKAETIMLHEAIMKSKRDIVLSLSPGPAKIEEAWFYEKYANMWRITDDFWDNWPLLVNMFDRCELWQNQVNEGCWPDCDMLPVGIVGEGFNDRRETYFTKAEQRTMMTLWSIFRSPMMIGGELTMLDDWTLDLLCNQVLVKLLHRQKQAKQFERSNKHCIWYSKDEEGLGTCVAVFNLSDEGTTIEWSVEDILGQALGQKTIKEMWSDEAVNLKDDGQVSEVIGGHDVHLYIIS